MDLQALSDKLEISELLARYARGVDSKDWELWRSVFLPHATLDYSSVGIPAGSRDEVGAFFEQGLKDVPMTQHFISNVEVDLDGDRAKVRALFYNPMQLPGMLELSYCGGYYVHDLVRTSEGWKSERLVEHNEWFVNRPGDSGKEV
jgi:3-phenylpropionate/cinnamic acid dioxygenase small subunit